MPFKIAADYHAAITLKVACNVLTVALALIGYGCGADRRPATPLSPSATVLPNPTVLPSPMVLDPNLAGERWRLTTTIVSLEGSACFWRNPVGTKLDWTLSVDRSGEQVRFRYDVNNPHDNLLFVGGVKGQSFTAVSDTGRSFWQCAGGVTISSSVVGDFSIDGRRLSGRERLMYRLDSGSELIIAFEWNAAPI